MSYYNKQIVDVLNSVKSRIKAEMSRRSSYYGSMTNYAASGYDFSTPVKENGQVKAEHLQKTKNLLLTVKDFGDNRTSIQESEPIEGIENMVTVISKMETEPIYGTTTSCRSACSGLCLGTCFNTCDGCTTTCSNGCSSCSGGCGTGCNAACGGGCSSGCGSGCANACGGACNVGCGSGCTSGCTGCTGCTGGCGGGCSGSCSGGCKGSCSGGCGGSY